MPSAIRPDMDGRWPTENETTDGLDFTQLWQRHIDATRHEFSKTLPKRDDFDHDIVSAEDVGMIWDEKMDSVVDALQELEVYVFFSLFALLICPGLVLTPTQLKPQHKRPLQPRNAMVSRPRSLQRDCALVAAQPIRISMVPSRRSPGKVGAHDSHLRS